MQLTGFSTSLSLSPDFFLISSSCNYGKTPLVSRMLLNYGTGRPSSASMLTRMQDSKPLRFTKAICDHDTGPVSQEEKQAIYIVNTRPQHFASYFGHAADGAIKSQLRGIYTLGRCDALQRPLTIKGRRCYPSACLYMYLKSMRKKIKKIKKKREKKIARVSEKAGNRSSPGVSLPRPIFPYHTHT